jgi:hypothetical protein
MASYLRRPPPPPPPDRERDAPTLDDPRWLLLRAAPLFERPLEAPPKALPFRPEEPWPLGMLRSPTRSPPAAPEPAPAPALPRFAPALLVAGDAPARFVAALPLPPRLAPVAG